MALPATRCANQPAVSSFTKPSYSRGVTCHSEESDTGKIGVRYRGSRGFAEFEFPISVSPHTSFEAKRLLAALVT